MPRRFLFCLLLTCSLTLPAQETRQTLHISAGEWPPYLSSQLPQQGVMAHLLRDVLADEGYQVEFRFLPWPRAYAAAAAGRFAATAVWMHKSEREQDFFYSDPVLDEQFVFFHLREVRFDWQTFSDLRGLTLGGSLEYSYGPAFDAFLERGEVPMERVSSDQQNFEKLLKGRIQLYPQERNVGLAALRNLSGAAAQITHHPRPLLVNQSYLLFPKSLPGSDLLRQRFDQRLQQYRDSGRYQRYFDDLDQGKYSASQATLNLP